MHIHTADPTIVAKSTTGLMPTYLAIYLAGLPEEITKDTLAYILKSQ